MSIKVINPLTFVDININIVNNLSIDGYACVTYNNSICTILYNNKNIQDLYLYVDEKIDYELFFNIFIAHEISHIKYESFLLYDLLHNKLSESNLNNKNCNVLKIIFNIIEDARIENRLSNQYMLFSKYFNFLLSLLKQYIVSINKDTSNENFVNDYIDMLYSIVRYKDYNVKDKEFLNLVLPLTRKTCYTNMLNEQIATYIAIIYTYISQRYEEKYKEELKEMNDKIVEKIIKSQDTDDKINKIYDSIQKDKTIYKVNTENNIKILNTIKDNTDKINKMYNLFKLLLTKFNKFNNYEGEVNLLKQQQLYIDSFTKDENKNYYNNKKSIIKLDVILLRDVSGSIGSNLDIYYESIIILLAALNQIETIRTYQADFETFYHINKEFDDKFENSKIVPRASGGTILLNLLQYIDTNIINYNNKTIVIILTDGQYLNKDICDKLIFDMKTKNVSIIEMFVTDFVNLYTNLGKKIYDLIRRWK